MFDFVYFINIKENKYGFKFSMDLMKTAERIYFVENEFLLEDNLRESCTNYLWRRQMRLLLNISCGGRIEWPCFYAYSKMYNSGYFDIIEIVLYLKVSIVRKTRLSILDIERVSLNRNVLYFLRCSFRSFLRKYTYFILIKSIIIPFKFFN